ncbi:MAG TPA: GDCCVxC domain-containing (seleno)protein [Mariprofundaceae bacterium]|nr:GDCCVxC domain-containing (seleno)protein [Mariprofundaceae bacterium]
MAKGITTESSITCPECGYSKKEIMPTDACHALLKPKAGDCCVYCSYGDVPCPPIQQNQSCCE